MASTEIDHFIREQKSKLAQHRQHLRSVSPIPVPRLRPSKSEHNLNRKENIPPPAPPSRYQDPIPSQPPAQQNTRRQREPRRVSPFPQTSQEEVPLVARMVEGELQHHRFGQQRRQEIVQNNMRRQNELNQHNGVTAVEEEGLNLRRNSNSASKQRSKSHQRNNEYNDFLKRDQEKFVNRFADKKPPLDDGKKRSRRDDYISPRRPQGPPYRNDIRPPPPPQYPTSDSYEMPLRELYDRQPSPPRQQGGNRQRNTKMDELERQVEELRGKNHAQEISRHDHQGEVLYEPSFYQVPHAITTFAPPPPPIAATGAKSNRRTPWAQDNDAEDVERALPIRDRSMEEARKREERNREYNDFLRYKEVKEQVVASEKRGWGTPVYDDLLMEKRVAERDYRRYDDPELIYPSKQYPAAVAKGAVKTQFTAKLDDAERQLQDIEARYDKAKVKMFTRRDKEHRTGTTPRNTMADILDDDKFGGLAALDAIDRGPTVGRRRGAPETRFAKRIPNAIEDELGLPLGGNATDVERERRKKEVYAQELRRQMEEQKILREREKEDRRSPGPYLNRSRSANDILTGYAGGPGDSKMLSGGKIADVLPYNTPADDAYFYYASKNPLEEIDNDGGVLVGSYGGSAGSNMLRTQSQPGDISRKVRFDDKVKEGMIFASDDERKQRMRQERTVYNQELQRQMDDAKRQKEMRKREQAEYDRRKDEEIANYNPFGRGGGGAPMKDSDGNVITDLHRMHHGLYKPVDTARGISRAGGNLGTSEGMLPRSDHHHHHHGHVGSSSDLHLDFSGSYNKSNLTPRISDPTGKTPRQTNALGETTHARGGHGIFGQALSDEQKAQGDRYKEDLRIQIEERKREAEIRKQQQKEIEDKEQRRIDEQQRRMQAEYDEEQKRKREKEEEARRANDEVRRQTEEKRKEIDNKRKEEESLRLDELRTEQHQTGLAMDRIIKSPPIPTHAGGDVHVGGGGGSSRRSHSPAHVSYRPPVTSPHNRRPSEGSSHVLGQLATMRRQLDMERTKVESALARQRHQVEVHDPRLNQPSEIVVHGVHEPNYDVDVFEMVRNKQGPVPVRRAPSRNDPPQTASTTAELEEFRRLKRLHNRNAHPEKSREDETPVHKDDLEAQQEALLREQIGEQGPYASQMPGMQPKDLGLMRPETRDSTQLQSDTAFLGFNGNTYEDTNEYDKASRYGQGSVNVANFDSMSRLMNDTYESNSTVDVDDLARKNEERLRKLQRMQSDTISLNDPEEVLHRFMDRQSSHKERPPSRSMVGGKASRGDSRHTLEDDSWLDPSK